MDAFKIAFKLFTAKDEFAPSEFVPIFQRWIQRQALPDHVPIDVADYAHVHSGPGTVLVTSEANIYMDRTGGKLGLLYTRKLPLEGTFRERLAHVAVQTLKTAILLQQEPSLAGRLTFRTEELLVRINDRLLAPNTDSTAAAIKPDIQAIAAVLYPGAALSFVHPPDPQKLLELLVKTQQSVPLATLLERLEAARPAGAR
jgi:hypothetical protein